MNNKGENMHTDGLLTIKETTQYLKVGRSTLAQWRKAGIGPRYIALDGKSVRYRVADLNRYISSRTA